MRSNDTIVAVSSPPGRSPRGLVRLSGSQSWSITRQLRADSERHKPDADEVVRRVTVCHLRLGDATADEAAPALPALICLFRGPQSYTGDDMVEIQVPGNPALLDRLVRRSIDHGARMAEPGEFTFRAFLAGKLDLTQAEGVAATIAAVSDSQLEAAVMLRAGRLGRLAADLVDQAADALALIEAGIDFTDQEDVVPIAPAVLDERLVTIETQLDDLLAHSRPWGALEALPRVVLVGPPNSGKSTLFNALLGRVRAVTSPLAGTTRDVLAEPLTLSMAAGQKVEVLLCDLAGLDEPAALLDEQVQAAARAAIQAADLIVLVSQTPADDDGRLGGKNVGSAAFPMVLPPTTPILPVRTKIDLCPGGQQRPGAILVSACTGVGLDELRRAITVALGHRAVSIGGAMLALQPRHEAAIHAATRRLSQARGILAPQCGARALRQPELIAESLRHALRELAGLGGQLTPDELIGRIFARFCIGK